MKSYTAWLGDENETQSFATTLALMLKAPLTITLQGEIGAGKTTFVRALLRALGVNGPIKSPTYTLVESYFLSMMHNKTLNSELSVHHFDLYRIIDTDELEFLGFRDYFKSDAICCIEWPEKAQSMLGPIDLALTLHHQGEGRQFKLEAKTSLGEIILKKFEEQQTGHAPQ